MMDKLMSVSPLMKALFALIGSLLKCFYTAFSAIILNCSEITNCPTHLFSCLKDILFIHNSPHCGRVRWRNPLNPAIENHLGECGM